MKKIKNIGLLSGLLSLMILGTLSVNMKAQSGPCEEEVTYQFDDGDLCDPAGNSCIVIWGCPEGD